MSKDQDDDFAAGLYTEPTNAAPVIPLNKDGSWRVAVFTPPCRSSAELEARAKQYEAEAARGDHEIPFYGLNGELEVPPLTPEEFDSFRDQFTDAEWAQLLEELK